MPTVWVFVLSSLQDSGCLKSKLHGHCNGFDTDREAVSWRMETKIPTILKHFCAMFQIPKCTNVEGFQVGKIFKKKYISTGE